MEEIEKGDIYYANLDPVLGNEQGGLRPVVIIQNNVGNHFSNTVIVAPITTKIKKKKYLPSHVFIKSDFLKYKSVILFEQIKTIDRLRLQNFLGKVSKKDLRKIDKALIKILSIDINKLLI